MRNISINICLISILLISLFGKSLHVNTKLTLIGSFKQNSFNSTDHTIRTKLVWINNELYYFYLSKKDTSLVFFPLTRASNGNNITLKSIKGINAKFSWPISFSYYKDTIALLFYDWQFKSAHLAFLDRNGSLISYKNLFYHRHIYVNGNIDYADGRLYMFSSTDAPGFISNVNRYCDDVYANNNGCFVSVDTSGTYPEKYFNSYVHVNEFFRIMLKGGNLVYVFQSDDTIVKYSNSHFKQYSKIDGYENEVLSFDTTQMRNMRYINSYTRLTGQNEQCFYDGNSMIYIIKRLKRNSITDTVKRVLIALDTNLVIKYEQPVDGGLYYADNKYIYYKKFNDSIIYKYVSKYE
ncbi:MAG: hypothetical protein ACTHJ0_00935 [Flavipsychrobacter sp.]